MRTRRRRSRARLLIGAAVVVAALAVGGVAWARSGGSPAYRTATVARGAVTSTLSLPGTVTPMQSASVGFAQSGTVASVDVKAGDTVTAGQTLAQLDLTSLDAKLTQAKATEAAARQTLAEAENGQLPSGTGSGSGGSAGSGSGGSTPGSESTGSGSGRSGSGASSSATTTAALTSAQQAVESAQQAVDQAQSAARAAVSAAGSACDSSGGSVADPAACLGAETAAMQAESTLSKRQTALTSAQSALATQLTKAATTSTTATTPSASSSTTTVSAVQLAQYQAALDADTAAVNVAQQNLGQGTAVSPLSGTVVSVGVTAGASVSAASSTQVIVISSPNGYEVDATVPTADISSVKVGQNASVTADGVTAPLSASLTSISPTAGSSGFAVVFGLSGTDAALRQGTAATVTLTTGSVSDGIVVPTSAVHAFGTRDVVQVLDGGTLQTAVVTTGVTGPLLTQVVSGLKLGQRVVLADLSSTVTSDSSTTTGTTTGLTGGRGFTGGRIGGGAGFGGRAGG